MVPEIRNILFTTDLSKQARRAFMYALSLANQYGANLAILYVMEDPSPSQSAYLQAFIGDERWEELRQSHEQEIRQILIGKKREGAMIREALGEMLAETQKQFKAPGLKSEEIVVTQGDPVDCILQEAEARQSDLIVMGYHPRGRLESAIIGSVSRRILRRAKVPVLLVRLPDLGEE
ncbi:MAG: universal stress protein [Desulfobacterales bacterium]|jgi:nucleotide-binding universal stress UspA family protein|nr:universal stress protein [Desulfobacterales bacterium]MCU0585028.1 universal stress protein [Desulfobacterales bacterium]